MVLKFSWGLTPQAMLTRPFGPTLRPPTSFEALELKSGTRFFSQDLHREFTIAGWMGISVPLACGMDTSPPVYHRSIFKTLGLSALCMGLGLFLFGFTWYRGFIPICDAEDRARLRDSLNLWVLPSGTEIIRSGFDDNSNRFYAFDAEISIRPASAEQLLSGRPFGGRRETHPLTLIGCIRTIYPYRGFSATESYWWQHVPDFVDGEEPIVGCCVYFNSTRDRAFVHYTSE